MPMLTVRALAREAGISRATLLHYEALGLLQPAARSEAGYRLYGAAELARLQAIRGYREAGLSLVAIGRVLAGGGGEAGALLQARLLSLGSEIAALRAQQHVLACLLAEPERMADRSLASREAWVAMLREAGLDEAGMRAWHVAFEREAPAAHARFLQALGLGADEIAQIRRWAKEG